LNWGKDGDGDGMGYDKMPPADRWKRDRNFVLRGILMVVVEVLNDMAQVWMGAVLVDRCIDVLVHQHWEGYMVVA